MWAQLKEKEIRLIIEGTEHEIGQIKITVRVIPGCRLRCKKVAGSSPIGFHVAS